MTLYQYQCILHDLCWFFFEPNPHYWPFALHFRHRECLCSQYYDLRQISFYKNNCIVLVFVSFDILPEWINLSLTRDLKYYGLESIWTLSPSTEAFFFSRFIQSSRTMAFHSLEISIDALVTWSDCGDYVFHRRLDAPIHTSIHNNDMRLLGVHVRFQQCIMILTVERRNV